MHGLVDVLIAGLGLLGQQSAGRHNLAGLAVAALGHIVPHPGLLNGVLAAQAFDRRHLGRADRLDRGDARPDRLPVHMHRAGAALGQAAAELGSGHAQFVAQHPEQGRFRRGLHGDRLAVDIEGHGHASSPPNERRDAPRPR